jgi:hypothetical protein
MIFLNWKSQIEDNLLPDDSDMPSIPGLLMSYVANQISGHLHVEENYSKSFFKPA